MTTRDITQPRSTRAQGSDHVHQVLWTGGFDSTFRILQLLRHGHAVCPYYLCSITRKSQHAERAAMDTIRSLLPSAGLDPQLLQPTVLVDAETLPHRLALTASWDRLAVTYRLGEQYEWLAQFAEASRHAPFELSLLGTAPASQRLHANCVRRSAPPPDDVWELAPELDEPDLRLFRSFVFPLLGWTKPQMLAAAASWGVGELVDATWFCHWPTAHGQPCGRCPACRTTAAEGLAQRITPPSLDQPSPAPDTQPPSTPTLTPDARASQPPSAVRQVAAAIRLGQLTAPLVSRIPRVRRLAADNERLRARLETSRTTLADRQRKLEQLRGEFRTMRRERQLMDAHATGASFDQYLKLERHVTAELAAEDLADPIWRVNNKIAGVEFAAGLGLRTPRRLQLADTPQQVQWSTLPDTCVIKAEDGKSSEGVLVVQRQPSGRWFDLLHNRDCSNDDIEAHLDAHFRAIGTTSGRVLVESVILRPGASLPSYDWKLFVIGGRVELLLQKDPYDPADGEGVYRMYDRDLEDLGPVRTRGTYAPQLELPSNPQALLAVAERVAAQFDVPVVRVDLFDDDHGPVFGEITPNPGGSHWYGVGVDQALGRLLARALAQHRARTDHGTLEQAPSTYIQ